MFFKIFIFLVIILIIKDYMDGGIVVDALIKGGAELFTNVSNLISEGR